MALDGSVDEQRHKAVGFQHPVPTYLVTSLLQIDLRCSL